MFPYKVQTRSVVFVCGWASWLYLSEHALFTLAFFEGLGPSFRSKPAARPPPLITEPRELLGGLLGSYHLGTMLLYIVQYGRTLYNCTWDMGQFFSKCAMGLKLPYQQG
eukprot:scaffold18996_cov63-Attheya_sp.AAC.1